MVALAHLPQLEVGSYGEGMHAELDELAKAKEGRSRPARSPVETPAEDHGPAGVRPPDPRRPASSMDPAGMIAMQQTAGNAAVVQYLARSRGEPLSTESRAAAERTFGQDFSSVRVHRGAEASTSAASLGARAYTSGEHVVLGGDGDRPTTLAHELTHVVQQRAGRVAGTPMGGGVELSHPSDRFENEARAVAALDLEPSTAGRSPAPGGAHGSVGTVSVQREDHDDSFWDDPEAVAAWHRAMGQQAVSSKTASSGSRKPRNLKGFDPQRPSKPLTDADIAKGLPRSRAAYMAEKAWGPFAELFSLAGFGRMGQGWKAGRREASAGNISRTFWGAAKEQKGIPVTEAEEIPQFGVGYSAGRASRAAGNWPKSAWRWLTSLGKKSPGVVNVAPADLPYEPAGWGDSPALQAGRGSFGRGHTYGRSRPNKMAVEHGKFIGQTRWRKGVSGQRTTSGPPRSYLGSTRPDEDLAMGEAPVAEAPEPSVVAEAQPAPGPAARDWQRGTAGPRNMKKSVFSRPFMNEARYQATRRRPAVPPPPSPAPVTAELDNGTTPHLSQEPEPAEAPAPPPVAPPPPMFTQTEHAPAAVTTATAPTTSTTAARPSLSGEPDLVKAMRDRRERMLEDEDEDEDEGDEQAFEPRLVGERPAPVGERPAPVGAPGALASSTTAPPPPPVARVQAGTPDRAGLLAQIQQGAQLKKVEATQKAAPAAAAGIEGMFSQMMQNVAAKGQSNNEDLDEDEDWQ
jgi:hypothetical protein